ncbi:hypothetical protein [Kamptonema formosum]|uniref:hypothetical protein n=1 Tax=Kamptonema formosum TaxID=331992 RepID=UPI000349DBBF|nr:hypothetical protein [Oscillatoria sp. PCC 10802]
MTKSIVQHVNELPAGGVTVSVLQALDFVVPGEWNNLVGFENTVRQLTGETKADRIQRISERAVWLYSNEAEGYQKAMWVYQTIDNADTALGAAAMANKVSEKISFLGFLNKLTPKPDTLQSIDLALKIVGELIAFSALNKTAVYNIPEFVKGLSKYHNEALMRMAALVCFDGLLPLGPDFIRVASSTIAGLKPANLQDNAVYQQISSQIPGDNIQGQIDFIGNSFKATQGWMGGLVNSRGLKPEGIIAKLQGFVDIADDKLDYVAAFLDMSTNYYQHTGTQTVARYVIQRAAAQVK